MIIFDSTIVNVALPAIQGDSAFRSRTSAWVMNAYLIAFGGLLLLAGRLGDLVGRKSVFMIGLAVFTVASLLCGIAQSQELLIGARFVQGVGGALTSAVILGMIVTMFPEPREQAKAIGVYSFVASAGASIGLLARWRAHPGRQLALDLLRERAGRRRTASSRRWLATDRGPGLRHGADVLGAALITGALMLMVYTIVHAERARLRRGSHADPRGDLAGGSALRGARGPHGHAARCRCGSSARRNVTGANLVQMLRVAGLFGMFFLGALYLPGRARLRRDRRPAWPSCRCRSASACCRSASPRS